MQFASVSQSVIFGGLLLAMTTFRIATAQDAASPSRSAIQTLGGAPASPKSRASFPQNTRKLAPPDVITRGKALYGVNCTGCHGSDLRGGDMGGPNLLRSQVVLSDQHGELVSPVVHGTRQEGGMPAFNLSDEDTSAITEFLHSIAAEADIDGRPPGSDKIPELQVIVGNPAAGKAGFERRCASCHSVNRDLAGYAAKYPDPRTLQDTWVTGSQPSGRGGSGAHAATVSVLMANGQKINGQMLQANDFIVTLVQPDGTRRSISRDSSVKSVEVHEPNEAHKKIALDLTNKEMHDITAYLATIK